MDSTILWGVVLVVNFAALCCAFLTLRSMKRLRRLSDFLDRDRP